MTNLTAKEAKLLEACLNYDNREDQLADNYSNGDFDSLCVELDADEHTVGGIITSLQKKGLGSLDEEDDIFWLTTKGVNAIFDYLENK